MEKKLKYNMTIRLTSEEMDKLDQKAKNELRTRSGLVRKIVSEYLDSTSQPRHE